MIKRVRLYRTNYCNHAFRRLCFCLVILCSSHNVLNACFLPPIQVAQNLELQGNQVSAPSLPTYKGRVIAPVMSAEGADWLVRSEREEFEKPDRVLDALKLKEGMVVADIGAGVGYFSLRIAQRIQPSGMVLAVDVQPEMLTLLIRNKEQKGLTNLEPVLGTPIDPHLPQAMIDLALLVDVYHEFQYPAEMITQIRSSLRKEGRLVLIEYRGEDPSVPIKPEHKMTVKQVLREIEPMGFRLKERLEFLPWQHIFVFTKSNDGQEGP